MWNDGRQSYSFPFKFIIISLQSELVHLFLFYFFFVGFVLWVRLGLDYMDFMLFCRFNQRQKYVWTN